MKSHIIVLMTLACLSLTGCGQRPATTIPADSFRLSITDVFSDGDEHVCSVTIETLEQPRVSITQGINSYGDWPSQGTRQKDGFYREWVMSLAVSGITPDGSDKQFVKAKIRTGSGVTVTQVDEVPLHQALAKTLALNIQNGIYKLGTPLVIGTFQGRDLELSVRNELTEAAAR